MFFFPGFVFVCVCVFLYVVHEIPLCRVLLDCWMKLCLEASFLGRISLQHFGSIVRRQAGAKKNTSPPLKAQIKHKLFEQIHDHDFRVN